MNRFINQIKTLGLMAVMFALVASLAGAGSASASTLSAGTDSTVPPYVAGVVSVQVVFSPESTTVRQATVEFFNEYGQPVAKVLTSTSGQAEVKLVEGLYKVRVSAPGYQTVNQYVKVAADQVTTVKLQLNKSQFGTSLIANH